MITIMKHPFRFVLSTRHGSSPRVWRHNCYATRDELKVATDIASADVTIIEMYYSRIGTVLGAMKHRDA